MKALTKPSSVLRSAVALLAMCVVTPASAASPGDLDPSFGTGGIVTAGGSSTAESAQSVIVLPDRSILAAGYANNGTDNDFAVLRFFSDGAPDPSFGTNGMVTIPIGAANDRCNAAAVQADSRVVAAGSTWNGTDNDFALVRLTGTGALDPTFGTGGIATASAPGIDSGTVYAMAIQGDGRIIVAGRVFAMDGSNGVSLVLLRFTSVGTLDSTFGTGGIVTTTLGGTQAGADEVAIQEDGKIVVAGYVRSADASFDNFALARFTESGAPDPGFGTDGVVVTPVNPDGADYAEALALQNDGRIVAAGQTYLAGAGDLRAFAVARYMPNGALDTAFGSGGIATTRVGDGYESATSVAVQADGKIVATGACQTAGVQTFAAVRYTKAGIPDTSFADDGIATIAIGEYSASYASALQRNGGIVMAGYSGSGGDSDFTLVRQIAGVPRPDARFGKSRSVPRGNDIYDPARGGQAITVKMRPGRSKVIRIGIQNDSDLPADFKVRARRGNRAFRVRVLDGSSNVTAAVLSGGYRTGMLVPGGIKRLAFEIRARAGQSGKSRTFTVRGTAEDGTTHDTIRIKALSR